MPPKRTLSTRKFNRIAEAKVSIHDKTSALRSIGRRGNIESVNNCRAAMLTTSANDIAPPQVEKVMYSPGNPAVANA